MLVEEVEADRRFFWFKDIGQKSGQNINLELNDYQPEVGSRLVIRMLLNVIEYYVISNVTTSSTKTSPSPKTFSPVALLDLRILLLYFPRGTTFNPPYIIAHCNFWRYFNKHMNVVTRHYSTDYSYS